LSDSSRGSGGFGSTGKWCMTKWHISYIWH
jgi:hypothetical protein